MKFFSMQALVLVTALTSWNISDSWGFGSSRPPSEPARDVTAPQVSIISPSAGAVVSGELLLSAQATDNVGVTGLEFRVNGQTVPAGYMISATSARIDVRSAPNGTYQVVAVARDAASNQGTSASRSFVIRNGSTPSPTPTPTPTSTATPSPTPTSQPPSNGQALFSDDFEGYALGGYITGHGTNGFSWTGGNGYRPRASRDVARSGQQSIRFDFGPYEPNGNTHWWSEQRFTHPRAREYWVEYYVYFPRGGEGGSARYYHNAGSSSNNNKFYAFWADDYQSNPLGTFQLWANGDGTSRINVARSDGVVGGPARYPSANNRGQFITGDRDLGRWIRVRIHLRLSDFGRSNGILRLYKDNEVMVNVTNDPFHDPNRVTDYLRSGYLLGYDNGRYLQNTSIWIDDFQFFDRNPGW